jgi:epoxyqueuosine reductase
MSETREQTRRNPAQFLEREIAGFVSHNPINRLPFLNGYLLWDKPLVRFADGDDSIFTEYKKIIGPTHMTPREVLAQAMNKKPEELPARISVVSWVLPIAEETRISNRAETRVPSRLWSHTRWYGEQSNDALRRYIIELLTGAGYLAIAPVLQPSFKMFSSEKGMSSSWSERHIAFAAGQGTFSLSDGFITERGIAHRCGSVVTDAFLPASTRTAEGPYSNCLFYRSIDCQACIKRCPAGAISNKGHDKIKCLKYCQEIGYSAEKLKGDYDNTTSISGCGLCQTGVPCESANPAKVVNR